MKESQVSRRLREIAQWTEEAKASFVGLSVTRWRVLLRDEKRTLLVRAIRKEK